MKKIFFFSLLLWSVTTFAQQIPENPNQTDKNGLRQGKWTILLDKDWKLTQNKDSVVYYRLIAYKDDKPVGTVADYYRNGKKQFEGQLLADRPEEILNGTCVWYNENGNKSQEVTFLEGKVVGEVKEYKPDGTLISESWDYLYRQGKQLYEKGKYTEALAVFEKALPEVVRQYGKEHQDYATALSWLAELYETQRNYAKAESMYLEASAVYKKALGNENLEYANSLNNLAELYKSKGNYAKAEPLYLESLKIREKILGKEHPSYANSLNNLALLYDKQSNYAKAEPLYLEALRIREKASGKENTDYTKYLNNLAELYRNKGNYAKAEPLYLEALKIREKILGKEHPDYASSLNNLALLYDKQGNYAKAEPLYLEALRIREKASGKEHPDYATFLNNLANLYQAQGNYAKAEPLYLEACEVYKKVLGNGHPEYANSLNNLAYMYQAQGNYAKAEPLYLESLKIREKALGKEHPGYANSLNNLALLYTKQGNYAKVEPLFLEALKIREKSLGKEHPDYATSLNNLAVFYERQGNFAKAEPLFLEANQIYFHLIETQFSPLSEKEKEAFFKTFSYRLEIFNSFALKRKTANPAVIGNLYNNLLVTKAFLFNAQNKIRNNILSSKNPKLIQDYQDWLAKRQYLAKVYQMTLEQKQKAGINTTQLETEDNILEKQLSAQSEAFAKANDKKRYSWQDIQQSLKPNEAAVEIIRFRRYNKDWTDTVYYAALIVMPASKLPELVLLENGKELESKYIAYYKNAIRSQTEDKISYTQFWKPIADKFKTIAPKTDLIYFSPDGIYNSLNISTLLNPQTGKFTQEEINIQLLTTTKDLVNTKPIIKPTKDASLFGYPDFGNKNKTDTTRSLDFSYQSLKTDGLKRFFENGKISMLPGTKKEVNEIEKLLTNKSWKPSKYTLKLASENQLKALRNPRILHIATHGFFMQDAEDSKQERGFGGFDNQKITENPLLRSGLLLAGSQQAFDGKVNPDEEDGILTAYEAMNLNLDNTELVVLSACETGLGEIKNGEGVYGLQRAFQTAGAKAVIMSLWKVNDNSTQEFMSLFYENWLQTGNKRQAFQQAQNTLKDKYKKPYFWGAFVMIGE